MPTTTTSVTVALPAGQSLSVRTQRGEGAKVSIFGATSNTENIVPDASAKTYGPFAEAKTAIVASLYGAGVEYLAGVGADLPAYQYKTAEFETATGPQPTSAIGTAPDARGNPSISGDSAVAVAAVVNGLKTIVLNLSSEKTDAVDAFNTDALNAALLELYLTGGVIDLPNGGYFKTGGHIARADIFIRGRGESVPVYFEPTAAGPTTFITWIARQPSGTGTIPRANSELNIEKAGFINLTIEGNRAARANAFDMRNCDHGYLIDSTIKGMKGFSVRLSRCREMRVRGLITRYNGYCDPASIANCVSNIIVDSPTFTTAQGINNDTSNLSQFSQIQAVFSFWHEIEFNGAPLNGFSDFLIHGLPRANTSVEALINTLYGGSGIYAGGIGWDGSGTPRNEYAALHQGAASVASVSGRLWGRSFPQACGLFATGTTNLKVANGRLIGGGSLNALRATSGSSVAVSAVDISAAGTGVFSVAAGADVATDTFTIDTVGSGTLSVVPETGTTIELSLITTSPTPFILGRKGYLIRVSDTQFKIASTYANAIAGTALDITAPGSVLTFKTGGELLLATASSQIAGPQLGEFDDARVIARADETSTIRDTIAAGTTFSDGPLRPTSSGEQKLFAARNVNMNSTADTALKQLFVGQTFVVTEVQIVRSSGGNTTNNTVGGLYTGTSKSGTSVILPTTAYASLTTQYQELRIARSKGAASAGSAGAIAGNTGNGTVGSITAAAPAKIGAYKIFFLSVTRFIVVDPDGVTLGTVGSTGVAYSDSGLSFTITAGATPFVTGDGFTLTTTGTASSRFTSTTLYWSPTTAAGADMYCDIHVYGRVVD